MNKVSVKICSNPNCYIEGATLLKQLETMMCARVKNGIMLSGSECSGHCTDCGVSQAPCARIDGQLIPHAKAGTVISAIRSALA